MNTYQKVCAIIFRFIALISALFGIFGFITLVFIYLSPGYEKHTSEQAFSAGLFYLALGAVIFLLSKPLAKLICMNLED